MYGEKKLSTQGFKGFFAYTDKETSVYGTFPNEFGRWRLTERENEIVEVKNGFQNSSLTVISVIQLHWIRKVFQVNILFQASFRYNRARKTKYVLFLISKKC